MNLTTAYAADQTSQQEQQSQSQYQNEQQYPQSQSQQGQQDQYNRQRGALETGSSDSSSESMSNARSGQHQLHSANDLIGWDVYDLAGEQLGEIYDLVLEPGKGQIAYAVLSHGSVLGVGGSWFAVPLSEFTFQDERATLNVQKADLENREGFAEEHWPAKADKNWLKSSSQRDSSQSSSSSMSSSQSASSQSASGQTQSGSNVPSEHPENVKPEYSPSASDPASPPDRLTPSNEPKPGNNKSAQGDMNSSSRSDSSSSNQGVIARETLWAHRVSQLIGLDVKDQQDQTIGSLEDLAVNTSDSSLEYAMISNGSTLGVGGYTSAVPVNTLKIQTNPRAIQFSGDQSKLMATRLEQSSDDLLTQPSVQQRIDDQFSDGMLGLGGLLSSDKGLAISQQDNGPWMADSSYNQQYKPESETTIKGEIESVGTFYPSSSNDGAESGTRLLVRSSDGNNTVVQAGPQSFMNEERIDLDKGDEVTITGSETTIDGRRVIIARQIRTDDQSYELRDEDGSPRWKISQSQQQRTSQASPESQIVPGAMGY
ncbi:MAG: PRC-barrel domain-containing protein [Phycisphaeraceae bacterium]|nr:PRC-barrel domain-containing protein [Phycisphaeraceae bacterium]